MRVIMNTTRDFAFNFYECVTQMVAERNFDVICSRLKTDAV
jgi:hypothetical protein